MLNSLTSSTTKAKHSSSCEGGRFGSLIMAVAILMSFIRIQTLQ